ncbi:lipid-A-disaccharide synthase [Pseudoxanthobacter soli DSM 19599]|uniref:Lipid-A-disaccharide synthase n=1 Tax=Pseudoxanthobacter soli DSM 19599 TaxID=1123029 RepID=A0A1M7ZQD6_9HYPH|nr:lipid-A-disaccharide synthase [Pseudoxanthobacter soli]SHO67124.1 lipid-A-disaccharide synthase [Pseudoxanthobacter soli DSM 19599]
MPETNPPHRVPLEGRPLRLFIVAGEESGDQLGAALIRALPGVIDGPVEFAGIGGERMARAGVASLFPLSDIAVMGMTEVLARLPTILRRIREAADAAIAAEPDAVIIIDSPDFTHRVAKRIRKARPDLPIVDYVSPSVWAWRPGRARKMAAYVDHLLAILPFEPDAHRRLGGPPCTYVGHPLLDHLAELRPAPGERARLGDGPPVLLVLPGSRRSEVSRLMEDFGRTLPLIVARTGPLEVLLPAVPHLADRIEAETAGWPVKPVVVRGEAGKRAAFRRAHAALAASGTVSLELALAGVPMAIAYRLDAIYRQLKKLNRVLKLARVGSMVLPNIILGENVVPEFLDDDAAPEKLADAVVPLLSDSPERRRQVEAFATLDTVMRLEGGISPSRKAAEVVADVLHRR